MADSTYDAGVNPTGASEHPELASNEIVVHEFTEEAVIVHAPRPPERDPAAVYLARLAPRSRRTMRGALATMAAILAPGLAPPPDPLGFPWERVRSSHSKMIRAELNKHYSFTTTNKMLSALRGVLREAWELRLMNTEDYHRAVAVRAVKGQRAAQASGRSLARAELRALIQACLEPKPPRQGEPPVVSEKGQRDAALVALGYGCGLRRHELAGLTLEALDLAGRKVRVWGKGNKERVVPIPPGAFHALQDYLEIRNAGLAELGERAAVGSPDPEDLPSPAHDKTPLFVRARKGGRLEHEAGAITDQAVYHVLQTRAKEAEVEAFSPHDLRRSYVGDLLDEGADLSVARQLAGHASPTTTAGYDRRGDRAKEQAAARLDVPYDAE